MGLCKCQKRKVTNLFCFEHDVNVCEYCLVSDHEGCIVQSYVQWLQDSDYNPICILCKKLLKEEPTIRLTCYDVFHWTCLDKYASELPANTAPAGYSCPKCKECIFPPSNLVSPVVDVLKQKLETVNWSRVGLGQSLIQIDDVDSNKNLNETDQIEQIQYIPKNPSMNNLVTNVTTDDESNGFVIVKQKNQQINNNNNNNNNQEQIEKPQQDLKNEIKKAKIDMNVKYDKVDENTYYNRSNIYQTNNYEPVQSYDSSLGIVLNIDNLDRDTGENKYKRRPLSEWFTRLMRSHQLSQKFRMTRQKKMLFIVLIVFISLFTLIVIFSRLGSISTENDPALDPMNNPNIRIQ